MKIGIITMHRVIHFGSVLQAYALQQTLFKMGFENEIIDYIYPNEWHTGKREKSIKGVIYDSIMRLCRKDKITNKIASFISRNLITSKESYKSPTCLARKCPEYDIYITGSDQVWNTDYLKGDKSFFLDFLPRDTKKISYASSFGRFSYEGDQAVDWLSNLQSYSSISVRERKAQEIIRHYTGLEAELVLDPTLLISKKEWEDFAGNDRIIYDKYILVYILTYAWQPFPYALDVIKHFEKKLGWKVVVLEPLNLKEENPDWLYLENLSPNQFVNLFKNAGLVLTTSFHGTAFSINLETPFYSIVNDNKVNDDRISSLCESLQLTGNLLPVNSELYDLPTLEFNNSPHILSSLRESSISFLSKAIQGCLSSTFS